MGEGELPGMEEMAFVIAPAAVEGIPDHRVAQVFEMHADLMGSSRVRMAFDEGLPFRRGENPVLGEGLAATFIDGHFLAVNRMAADRGVNFPVRHAGDSLDKCQVGLADLAVCKLLRERAVGRIGFGDDEAAAGFLVEPVDDARSFFSSNDAQAGAVMEQGIDQGAVRVSRPGVNDEAGRFVQHEHGGILVEDVQRDVLGQGDGRGDFLRKGRFDPVPGAQGLGGACGESVYQNESLADEGLDANPGKFREQVAEVAVQAHPRTVFPHSVDRAIRGLLDCGIHNNRVFLGTALF